MKTSITSLTLAFVLAAVGCNQEPAQAPQAQTPSKPPAAEDAHDHHEAGPNGGTIADWGGGVYHVEFTVDHDAKSTAVFVLGSDGKTATPIAAKSVLLNIEEPSFQVELTPDPLPGEPVGAASRFVGTHDSLGMVQEFSGTISGEIDGTPYVGEFHEEAGEHGHDH